MLQPGRETQGVTLWATLFRSIDKMVLCLLYSCVSTNYTIQYIPNRTTERCVTGACRCVTCWCLKLLVGNFFMEWNKSTSAAQPHSFNSVFSSAFAKARSVFQTTSFHKQAPPLSKNIWKPAQSCLVWGPGSSCVARSRHRCKFTGSSSSINLVHQVQDLWLLCMQHNGLSQLRVVAVATKGKEKKNVYMISRPTVTNQLPPLSKHLQQALYRNPKE